MITKQLKFDKGIYQDAYDKGVSVEEFLEDHIVETEKQEPTEYYKAGMTGNVERAQLRAQFRKEGKVPPPTALEQVFASYGIKMYGAYSDSLSKVFALSDPRTLFPAWVSSRVYAGMIVSSPLDEFLAVTTVIKGDEFKKVYLEDTETQRSTSRGSKGGTAPLVRIKVSDKSVYLKKHWRQFEFNYEDLQSTPTGVIAVILERIGRQMGVDRFDDLIYNLINGDGNSNGLESAQTKTTVTSGSIEKRDIITFMAALPAAYTLSRGVATTTEWIKFADALSDMTNPSAQKAEVGMPFPKVTRWDSYMGGVTDRIYGVDKSTACGMVTSDNVMMTETDRVIERQVTKVVVSERSNFDVIDQDAIGCLDVTS